MNLFADKEIKRYRKVIDAYIKEFLLDFTDLTVFTEIASNAYLFTPLICILAGAKKVYAISKDSSWGKKDDFILQAKYIMSKWNIDESQVVFLDEKDLDAVADSDIIMNMNFVRPIDKTMIDCMKPTAVIPLMWETWEVREGEIDLGACEKKGVLVMGTDEVKLNRFDYAGHLAISLLLDKKVCVFKSKIFFFASGLVGGGIADVFINNNVDFKFTSFDQEIDDKYKEYYISPDDKEGLLSYISDVDAIVCAEHCYKKKVIGFGGIITVEELKDVNETVILIYKGGMIDYEIVKDLDIEIYPDKKVPFGTFTTYSYSLDIRSPLEMNICGMKVAETMAKARLAGKSIDDSKKYALEHSMAMDF